MRISRPCYDKPHRCPGWAGGGWKSTKDQTCDGGYVTTMIKDISWWRDVADEATCTCGTTIESRLGSTGIERADFPAFWVDKQGRWSCPQVVEGYTQGHRPPIEYKHPAIDKWRFGHCAGIKAHASADRTPGKGCGVVTIPWALRKLDPTWWWGFYAWRVQSRLQGLLERFR